MNEHHAPPPLILASGSVYRRQMLERFGLPFDVIPADVDEQARSDEDGETLARRLSTDKAGAVADRFPGSVVIGCDQVAECDGRLLGKPGAPERALEQLSFTAGKDIHFHSAMTVRRDGDIKTVCVPTRVRMRAVSPTELRRYIELDRPLDCAGAMRSESLGVALTEFIRSDDPSALIGLPLIELSRLLRLFGLDPLRSS